MGKGSRNIFNYITPSAINLILKISKIDVFSIKRKQNVECIIGVYFLFKNNEIIYIGKSIDIDRRLLQHAKTKDYDEYSYIELKEEDLDAYERVLINKYQPKLNIDMVTQKIKKNGK